jgi:chemotaxis regulatin CheY-phosphate phosphatase CheZ
MSEVSAVQKVIQSGKKPAERIGGISRKLRQIAKDLEVGKEVNPKKISHLAGSLDYWLNKIQWAAVRTVTELTGE